jgi:predicted DNA-binding protein (UPF0251 family)
MPNKTPDEHKMPRPPKFRRVTQTPGFTYFKPQGIPMSLLDEVVLTVDEFEALRLADLQAHSHEEAATKMKISRATFGRIIEKARQTLVEAIVNGKAIRIEGGNYRKGKMCEFQCRSCNRRWQFSAVAAEQKDCPRCKRRGWSR